MQEIRLIWYKSAEDTFVHVQRVDTFGLESCKLRQLSGGPYIFVVIYEPK